MTADIDSLQIEIEASSDDAARKIRELGDALEQLRNQVGDGGGLKNVTSSLKRMASVNLNNVNGSKLSELATALKGLSEISKPSGLTSAVNALKKLPSVMSELDNVDMSKLKTQMSGLATAMRPLASEMQRISSGFSAFPSRIQSFMRSNNTLGRSLSSSTGIFSTFRAGLAKGVLQIGTFAISMREAVKAAADWVMSANEYIENVNLFQVSMGEFYDEAFAYAELVNEKMGIDPSEWMRNQGVFMSMAKGFGLVNEKAYQLSKGLTELTYDLSSLYNEDVTSSAQRLQSALAGEIEPIRRLGISITQATLQEYAFSKGITESVSSMTEQEKALLRSVKLIEDAKRIGAVGDFARTLESPANALRILNQQITQMGRALGNALLPIIVQVIPWVQAFVSVVTDAIKALATFVGLSMPEWDNSSWANGLTDGADSATSALGGAADAAKDLKKATLGIDELNIISPQDASGAGAGGTSGWANDLAIDNVWTEGMLDEIQSKTDSIKETMKDMLPLVAGVGTALLAWSLAPAFVTGITTIAKSIGGLPGLIATVKNAFLLLTSGGMVPATGAAGALAAAMKFAGPIAVIATLVARFVDLYKNSEEFRLGLERIGEVFGIVFEVGKIILGEIWGVLKDVGGAILDLLPDGVKNAIIGFIEWVKEQLAYQKIDWKDLALIIGGIGLLFVPGGQVLGALMLGFETITILIRDLGGISEEEWENMKRGVIKKINEVLQNWRDFKKSVAGVFEDVRVAAQEAWDNIASGLTSAWEGVTTFFTETIPQWWEEHVKPWFTLEKWKELGSNAIDGLVSGFGDIFTKGVDLAKNLLSGFLSKDGLDINSPSKKFEEAGVYSVEGLMNGFWGSQGNFMSGVAEWADGIFNFTKGLFGAEENAYETGVKFVAGLSTGIMISTEELLIPTITSTVESVMNTWHTLMESSPDSMVFYREGMHLMQGLGYGISGHSYVVINPFRNLLNSLVSLFESFANRTVDALNDMLENYGRSMQSVRVNDYGGVTFTPVERVSIPRFANGGYPAEGSLFYANEAGPELIGNIGNRAAVANTDQIVEAVASGVYEAVSSAMSKNGDGSVSELYVFLDGKQITATVEKRQRERGRSIMKGGVMVGV